MTIPAFPGAQLALPTTGRIYDQGLTSESCCAHAVASAVETSLVALNGMDPVIEAVRPLEIYDKADHIRSVSLSLDAARSGLSTPRGVEHADGEELGLTSAEAIVGFLNDKVPLVAEIHIDSEFTNYGGPLIYRAHGALRLHAVCILGYGVYPGTFEDYWIAKNSYGHGWGMGGFALLLRRDDRVRPEESISVLRRVSP